MSKLVREDQRLRSTMILEAAKFHWIVGLTNEERKIVLFALKEFSGAAAYYPDVAAIEKKLGAEIRVAGAPKT